MFKKPHSSKTSAPLRSSDLRKLRIELSTIFNLTSSSLLKQLLPDGLLTFKATTHLEESVIIYSNPSTNDPLLFRFGLSNILIPTIYLLDLLPPNFLPTLVTAQEVVPNLITGAALFSVGISEKSLNNLPDSMKVGDLVLISAQGSDKIVAIGHLAASKKELVKDRKGKAVITLHARGDYLYKAGSETIPIPLEDESLANTKRGDKVDGLTSTLAESNLESSSNVIASSSSVETGSKSIVGESKQVDSSNSEPAASIELSTADIDLILLRSLLLSIRQISSLPPATLSKLFPFPASTLYSTYILPFRPYSIPVSQFSNVEIKKSSYKKLNSFIKDVASKKGWINAKEVKGEYLILGVNGTHDDVVNLKGYKTLAEGKKSEEKLKEKEMAANGGAGGMGGVVVRELFKPSSGFNDLREKVEGCERPPSDLYTFPLLLSILKSYIQSQNLSHPKDQKFLKLDSTLLELLAKKGEVLEFMGKEEAGKRLRDGCAKFWELAGKSGEPILKKGSPPLIKIALKNVGKRMVTLITNYEPWETLFSSEELVEELKYAAASSCSVSPLSNSSPKKPLYEIMIQGSHEVLVTKTLVSRGVPKIYIELDLSKAKR